MLIFIITLVCLLSIALNVLLIWYIRKILEKLLFVSDNIGDLLSISRESVSRILNRRCFNLNENNFRISFKRNGNTYIYNHLLDKEGKIIKLSNINN